MSQKNMDPLDPPVQKLGVWTL